MPNSKDNQRCWNCEHFQRYATGEEPNAVYGDCRREPMPAYLWIPGGDWFDSYVPFIQVGSVFWCSKWKQTNLTVPPVPENPIVPTWPDVFWFWDWWNKKESINISCLTCNHYQRFDPDDPQDLWGYCRKYPPEPTTTDEFAQATNIMPGDKIEFYGPDYWCGVWERVEV